MNVHKFLGLIIVFLFVGNGFVAPSDGGFGLLGRVKAINAEPDVLAAAREVMREEGYGKIAEAPYYLVVHARFILYVEAQVASFVRDNSPRFDEVALSSTPFAADRTSTSVSVSPDDGDDSGGSSPSQEELSKAPRGFFKGLGARLRNAKTRVSDAKDKVLTSPFGVRVAKVVRRFSPDKAPEGVDTAARDSDTPPSFEQMVIQQLDRLNDQESGICRARHFRSIVHGAMNYFVDLQQEISAFIRREVLPVSQSIVEADAGTQDDFLSDVRGLVSTIIEGFRQAEEKYCLMLVTFLGYQAFTQAGKAEFIRQAQTMIRAIQQGQIMPFVQLQHLLSGCTACASSFAGAPEALHKLLIEDYIQTQAELAEIQRSAIPYWNLTSQNIVDNINTSIRDHYIRLLRDGFTTNRDIFDGGGDIAMNRNGHLTAFIEIVNSLRDAACRECLGHIAAFDQAIAALDAGQVPDYNFDFERLLVPGNLMEPQPDLEL